MRAIQIPAEDSQELIPHGRMQEEIVQTMQNSVVGRNFTINSEWQSNRLVILLLDFCNDFHISTHAAPKP